MRLAALIRPELIFPEVGGSDRPSILRFFAERIACEEDLETEWLYRKLLEREELGTTGIGGRVAVPHCRCDQINEAVLAVGLSDEGVEFGASDGKLVHLFFVIVSPASDPQQNLRVLAAIARWAHSEGNVERVLAESNRHAILEVLAEVQDEWS